MAAWQNFVIASWLVPVSLGQTCFVLIWSGTITLQENICPEMDMSQTVGGSLMYRSPIVFLDRWYPRFRNFNSVVPIDVIREKSLVDSFLDPTGVPV